MLKFMATVTSAGPKGAWTGIFLTKKQSGQLGSRARVPVVGTLNGYPIRTSFAPMGDGTHAMMVNKQMQAGAKVKPGDRVKLVLEVDTKPRAVEVPADLLKAIGASAKAAAFFGDLAFTHRKDFVDWVTTAKRPQTRERRIAETVRMLAAGKKRQIR